MPDTQRRDNRTVKNSPAEWLLARVTTADRAAAMMGDLLEVSARRSRFRFWTAYARTLIALTWRIPAALFAADVCRQMIFDLFHLYLRHTPAVWRTENGAPLFLLNSSGPLLACIMSTLWFALPYGVVLYGRRDRFVQLAMGVTLGTTVAFLVIPWASLLFAAVTLALVAAALISKPWRRPLEVLSWTAAAGILTLAATAGLKVTVQSWGGSERSLGNYAEILAFQGSLLVLALVCSRLHRLLLRQPPTRDSMPA